jgi:hypothetical protein
LGAVILDPVVGDIGDAIICDRDISGVKASKQVSPAGSHRQNSWADGCYFGSFLGGTPTQYVHIQPTGIDIVSTGTLTFQSSNATLDSDGNLTVTGNITGNPGGGTVDLLHKHTAPSGGGETSAPIVGT